MRNVEPKVEKQAFKLFHMDTQNDKEVIFTLEASGLAENEAHLMQRSVKTILSALKEDLNNDYEIRKEIAKDLLLQIADFVADDNSKDNTYKSRANQKALLVELTNLL